MGPALSGRGGCEEIGWAQPRSNSLLLGLRLRYVRQQLLHAVQRGDFLGSHQTDLQRSPFIKSTCTVTVFPPASLKRTPITGFFVALLPSASVMPSRS